MFGLKDPLDQMDLSRPPAKEESGGRVAVSGKFEGSGSYIFFFIFGDYDEHESKLALLSSVSCTICVPNLCGAYRLLFQKERQRFVRKTAFRNRHLIDLAPSPNSVKRTCSSRAGWRTILAKNSINPAFR